MWLCINFVGIVRSVCYLIGSTKYPKDNHLIICVMQGRNNVNIVRMKRYHSVMIGLKTARLSSSSRLIKNFVLLLVIVSVKLGLSVA